MRLHCDILGIFPEAENGYKYILLVVDSFSRFLEILPLKSMESVEVAERLYTDIVCRYGLFKSLVTDLGRTFLSKVIEHLCDLCGIRRAKAIPYHAQSNSASECINKAIYKNLKICCQADNSKWTSYLSTIAFAHRSTVSIYSTQFSAFELMFGRKMMLPADPALTPKIVVGTGSIPDYMRTLGERVKILHQLANENILASTEVYKKQYDKQAKPCEYSEGEQVWMYAPSQLPAGKSKKMQINFNKLVTIKEKVGDTTYRVIDSKTKQEVRSLIHVDNLRSYKKELTKEDYINGSFKKVRSSLETEKNLVNKELEFKGVSDRASSETLNQLENDAEPGVSDRAANEELAAEGISGMRVSEH